MADTKIKAGQFSGIVSNGTDGYFLMTNGDGTMAWAEGGATGPSVTSVSYPGDDLAADPVGGQTVVLTGTGFAASGMTVSIGGTTAPSVAHDSNTQLTITTPAKAAGDYDIVVTNTVTGASGTFVNGISYNGIPTWTTAAGSLGTFESETTISTITLQATEPDGGTITFNITNGALPTGLSLTGANIDGTTTAESSTTLYSFTIEAIDDENQATPRNFSITVNSVAIIPSENFTINTYTGNGSTRSIEGKIGTAAEFNGSSSNISLPTSIKPSNSIMSISLWASNNSTARKNIFYLEYNNAPSFLALENNLYTDSTALGVYYNNTIVITAANETLPTDGSWHHIVVTASATEIKLYKNGSQIGSTASVTVNTNALTEAHIGVRHYNNDLYWDGKIDQVRIFNKKLSTDNNGVNEITTLYSENNASSTKSTTDIFGDGSGVALYEFDGDANDTGTGAIDSGQSAVFNGSSSYISASIPFLNAKVTSAVSLWIRYTDTGAYRSVFNDYSSTANFNHNIIVNQPSTGNVRFFSAYGGSSGYKIIESSGLTLNDGNWHHIVSTVDLSTNTLTGYVDGVPVGNVTVSTNSWTGTTQNLQIGRQETGAYFNGSVDQVRIYSSALDSGDVTNLYNESNVPTANLVAHYKLDGDATDETTNYDGTWGGTEAYSDPAEFPAYNGTPTNVNFLGMAFQPDLVWIKSRSDAYNHYWYDSIRGANNQLLSNATSAEATVLNRMTSFDSNGFTVESAGSFPNQTNGNGLTFAAWCWKAGGSVTPNNNTDGDITSTVSANPDAGFSIVKQTSNNTNQTYGHGLSQAPEMIISKNMDVSGPWGVYHKDLGTGKWLYFNTTASVGTSVNVYPTVNNTVFSGGSGGWNNLTYNYINYCFHSVDGYQKVGSYTGDGNTNGPTITLGFTPRFVMIKATENVSDWLMFDTVRDSVSPTTKILYANLSSAEQDGITDRSPDLYIEVTSNGFQIKGLNNDINVNGETFIYLAIA